MNKQLTKKTIGIAASAALMASVAVSSSALAGPGNGPKTQGPQASAAISTWCEITDERAGEMTVFIKTEDKSSGEAYGAEDIASAKVDLVTKDRGPSWIELNFATPTLYLGVDATVTFDLCGLDLGKAINAQSSISLTTDYYPSSKTFYTAQCSDNPYTEEVEGGLKTADYKYLGVDCPQD